MKKIFLAIAMFAMLMSACSTQDEVANSPANTDETTISSFRILEEKEMTGEELFAISMGKQEDCVDADLYQSIHEKFVNDYRQLPALETENTGMRKAVSLQAGIYKTVRVEYTTNDQDNKPVTASALIVYPLLKKIKNVMLINHGTHIGFMLIPTKYTSVEAIMAATGSLCIMPDYIGLGSSASHPDLYLNHEVHGRTSIDAFQVLLNYAKEKRLPLDNDFKSYILGYSQGGSVSLASLRRFQQLDKATQERFHLAKVYCGDGPYDLRRTFETYVEDMEAGKSIGLGAVIPFVINSMFNSYPAEVADLNYEDFFTPWALSTNLPQMIRNNEEGVLDVMFKFNGKDLDDILNFDYVNNYPDNFNRVLGLMDRQNLCHGWKPQYPLQLLHCNPDGVVPFSNFEEAYEGLNNEYMLEPQVLDIDANLSPLLQHMYGMLVMIEKVLAGKM